jgi:hypothetical protein
MFSSSFRCALEITTVARESLQQGGARGHIDGGLGAEPPCKQGRAGGRARSDV